MIRLRASLFLGCLPFLLTAHASFAQPAGTQVAEGQAEDLSVSASLRVRHELLDGQPRVGLRARDEQLALRSTFGLEYRRNTLLIGAEVYDSRVYLDRPGSAVTSNEVNTLELVQAYIGADLENPLGAGTKARVQAGRMMLNLGSRRLVAADDYRNTTSSYTGLRADLELADKTSATFIYTLPQIRLPEDLPALRDGKVEWDRESLDLRLWGGLVARPETLAGAMVEIGYFRLHEFDAPARPTRNRNLHTVSARLLRDPRSGRWDFEAEGIYQFGGVRTGTTANAPRLPVSAWFLHLDAGYTLPGKARLRLSIEYDYASGDGTGRAFGRFDTLFGMRRAELAPSGIYNALARTNISTPGVRVEMAPTKRLDAFANYRALWLAARTDAFSSTGVRDPAGASGSFAGHQVEGRVRYWLIPSLLRAEVNAVWLAKGRFLRKAPNAPATGNTTYLSTALTATL